MSFFGKNIRKIRSIKKISQAVFAEIFGLSRASIGSYEEGRAEPKLEIIIQIANHFSITIDELINKELTVNDLYHFNLNTEPIFKQIPSAPLFSIKEMKLCRTKDLLNQELAATLDNITQSISLPITKPGDYLAVYIDETQLAIKASNLETGDTVVIRTDDKILQSPTKLWLIKHNNAIFISELVFLANKQLLFTSNTSEPYYVNQKDVDYLLPIQMLISNQVAPKTNERRMDQLELQVNELFKKL
ncbi:MAG: helix-turn-helix transcriptional regulator [Marinilabiliaceae bacterium]|nr:helix-turn-helix transcriptional regulator [Marinilabiliaceae bacterium]